MTPGPAELRLDGSATGDDPVYLDPTGSGKASLDTCATGRAISTGPPYKLELWVR
ncbi:MAG: hypothetical protein H6741_30255 [Alphaproteobacteria bacterium]|nr:hypothetical protein [Alphaproteobacteria bacterium]